MYCKQRIAAAILTASMVIAPHVSQAQALPSWTGPTQLGQWNLLGRSASVTPRAADGIVITVDRTNLLPTLHSPRFDVPKKSVTMIEIRYLADIVMIGGPVMVVGWLDDRLRGPIEIE